MRAQQEVAVLAIAEYWAVLGIAVACGRVSAFD